MTYRLAFLSLLLSFVLTVPAAPVFAAAPAASDEEPAQETADEDGKKEEAAPAQEEDPEILKRREEAERASEAAYSKMNKLLMRLSPPEQKHFIMMYTSHNVIQTVRVVQEDVGKAVAECGKNNPDMKEEMDAEHKEWNEAVNPVLKEAQANIDNMVVAQEYAPKAEMKSIFKAVDHARDETNDQIDKIPVTTPEACEYLLGKMEETKNNMVTMLKTTLMTFPRAFPDAEETEEPAEDEAVLAEEPAEEAPAAEEKSD
jgi:predicted  nucleic acid-binding Zn-ribbon protein